MCRKELYKEKHSTSVEQDTRNHRNDIYSGHKNGAFIIYFNITNP